jgi:hypothetical protein
VATHQHVREFHYISSQIPQHPRLWRTARELSHRHAADGCRAGIPSQTLDLMQCARFKIAGATVAARNERYAFDHHQLLAHPKTAGYKAYTEFSTAAVGASAVSPDRW